jgi:hypothetical protein
MRLGLIGPAKRNPQVLRERAEFMLDELRVDRAVYLGVDGALDDMVTQWAKELVHGDPADDAVWQRASRECAKGSSEQIREFLKAERSRQKLKCFESLPHANARTIEMFETVVAVLIHDKALLDEEDMLPASILVFGRSAEPVIHKIGFRCFLSPGPVTHANGGVALLCEEEGETVRASIYASDGKCVMTEVVAQPNRAARMTVQGGAAT